MSKQNAPISVLPLPIFDSSDSGADSECERIPEYETRRGEPNSEEVLIELQDDGTNAEPLPPPASSGASTAAGGAGNTRRIGWMRGASNWVTNAVADITDTVFIGSPSRQRRLASNRHQGGENSNDPYGLDDDEVPLQLFVTTSRAPLAAHGGGGGYLDGNGRLVTDGNDDGMAEYGREPYGGGPQFLRGHNATLSSESGEFAHSRNLMRHPRRVHSDGNGNSFVTASPGGGGEGGGINMMEAIDLDIDLVTAIRQYRRRPTDAFFSLVSTALTSRSFRNPVTGEELLEAEGDQALVALIIQSGCLDTTDPVVCQETRRLVDIRIVPSEVHNDRVNPAIFLFLRELFSVRCVRITETQRDLLRVSGFEFVQLLHSYPHVMKDIAAPLLLSIEFWSRVSRKMDIPLLIIGLGVIYFDIVALAMVVVQHFRSGNAVAGWVTVLSWTGGDLLNLFATRVLCATKADESVYGEWMSDFPTPWLKIIPMIPLFESFVFLSSLKHKFLARSNYVVQHDLVAMFTLTCITHSLFFATIQIMLQSYLHSWIGTAEAEKYFGWQLLQLATLISLCTALPLYLRFVVTFDSVNSVGFAFFGDQMPMDKKPPTSKFARVLAFVLLYFLEFNCFLLVIAVIHVSSCSNLMIIWISVAAIIIVFTLLMFAVTFLVTRSILRASKWLFLPVCLQIAFTVFFNLYGQEETQKDDCKIFLIIGGMTVIYGYVGWGMLIGIFSTWGIYKLWLSYKKDTAERDEEAKDGELLA